MHRLLAVCLLLFMGCQPTSSYSEEQLVGNWKMVEWKDLTNDKAFDVAVDFKFEENGRYIGNYGSKAEEGKYWIVGANLHTIEDGKAEKKVKITTLTNDTLAFEMNRVGAIEKMVLVREE
ncbi:MAG: lipocalin family protein [Bacteroidota bacterium]